jgi:hypothetical protein
VVSFAEWICEWLRLLHPFAVDQRIQASLLDGVLAKVQEGHRCWCRERSPKGQTNAIALRELPSWPSVDCGQRIGKELL